MPLALPTTDEIEADFKADIRIEIPGAATGDGSDFAAMAVAVANAAAPIYANGAYLYNNAFPDTTLDPVVLAKFGYIYGIPRLGVLLAAGSAIVEASAPTTIPAGTTLSDLATGNRYQTVGTTTVDSSLEAEANLASLTGGLSSNLQPGAVLQFESAPPLLNPQAVVVSMSGGDDAWDDVRWAQEITKQIGFRAQAGNIPHLIALAEFAAGVEACFVYPALRGSGTLDLVLTTSAASGTRVAGVLLVARVLGALQQGVRVGGVTIPGLPEDVFANTRVQGAVEQPTDVVVSYRASVANPFGPWPKFGAGYVTPVDSDTWYTVSSSSSLSTFVVGVPVDGTPVAPRVGNQVGVFFPSTGFCKGTVTAVSGSGPWTVTVDKWSASDASSPTEAGPGVGAVVSPWCSQLANIAGAPASGSKALSGAVPDFFAGLGPGEMTGLTADDVTRRRRWPRTTDVSPFTGLAAWPTDVTSRLSSLLSSATDGVDFSAAVADGEDPFPAVPSPSFLGAPPAVLTVASVAVIPF